jgi:Amt family ammonium transporter
MKNINLALLALPPSLLLPGLSHAENAINGANTAWVLTSTALVLFMTLPALALFYGGLVRSKNVLSVLMQCFAITALISVLWVAYGYSLAFTDGGSLNQWIGGLDKAFLAGVGMNAVSGDIPETLFVMFQMTFAIITPALVVGAFAERMKFSAMLWFSTLFFTFVYLPVCHWVWGGGWLQDNGVMDFAGGLVVHLTCGMAALVAALVIGRRRGFPQAPMIPHNLTMTVLGAGMLWVGWFGFNAGSALTAGTAAAMAMLVTHLGAAGGCIAWMTMEWKFFGKPSVLGIATGMVAGLGTITPASGFVGPIGAIAIGLTAGVVCFGATQLLKRKLHIDDSLDVSPVHGVGGILGSLLVAVFAAGSMGGLSAADYSMADQFMTQLVAILAVGAWTAVISLISLKLVDITIGLRVNADDETQGLDVVMHEETGYNF